MVAHSTLNKCSLLNHSKGILLAPISLFDRTYYIPNIHQLQTQINTLLQLFRKVFDGWSSQHGTRTCKALKVTYVRDLWTFPRIQRCSFLARSDRFHLDKLSDAMLFHLILTRESRLGLQNGAAERNAWAYSRHNHSQAQYQNWSQSALSSRQTGLWALDESLLTIGLNQRFF